MTGGKLQMVRGWLGYSQPARVAARTDRTAYDPMAYSDPPHQGMARQYADETSRYYDSRARVAKAVRGGYVQMLAERRANKSDTRWTFDRIGELIDVTKQRARAIAKNGQRGDIN